jgi:hypothetical protein
MAKALRGRYIAAWGALFEKSRLSTPIDSVSRPRQFSGDVETLVRIHSALDSDKARVAAFAVAVTALFVELQFQRASLVQLQKFATKGVPSPLNEDPRLVGLLRSKHSDARL